MYAEGGERAACRAPLGLRDGQATLPTPRASRSPVALTRVAHASRFPLVAHATATAHAHTGRAAVTRKAGRPYGFANIIVKNPSTGKFE